MPAKLALLQRLQQRNQERGNVPLYEPRGTCERLHASRAKELMISGPSGTGKSLACLQKLYRCAMYYPGFRALILRKTRASLSETGLLTWERDVLGFDHPLVSGKATRPMRHSYRFANGSEIVAGGLDTPAKFLSGEYDIIFVQQAEETTEQDWELCTTRLRSQRMPYQQMLGDCNPDAPTHWIMERAKRGALNMLESRHEDNPKLWDVAAKDWTPWGRTYIATLDALTGFLKARLRYGQWVQATGIIYTTFGDHNISERAEYNSELPVFLGVDQGFVTGHDRVFLFVHEVAPNCYDVFDEYYATYEVSEKSIEQALLKPNSNKPYRRPEVAYIDSSAAELASRFWAHDIDTVGATHRVEEGVQLLLNLFAAGEKGKRPGIRIHPRCVNFLRELRSYHRNEGGGIVKEFDHGPDACRYLCFIRRQST